MNLVPESGGRRTARTGRPTRPPVDPSRTTWTSGWAYTFRPEPWGELRARYCGLVGHLPEYAHMLAIIDSVRRSAVGAELGAFTSMHGQMVRPLPPVDPPYDLVAVRSPGSLRLITPGTVVVEHLSTTGHDDQIVRPVAEAVPLFWRFVAEKFGLAVP